ncbi:chymotrypsin-elastase inhibitor ixodidin-like [Bufo bufo]|uniref:chymotrypsin-elastase inhibitor ixodidin-like n=1 Tax=Bufo bufo TaxID=8384 RepID=UPI001ABEC246|nr:chymotrypsin-elastase inhibitor ixodidin-like [Bufo bufo]
MLKTPSVLLILALALYVAEATGRLAQATEGNRCPEANQSWENCGTACPKNCELLRSGPIPCTLNCVPGCYCKSPYIFLSGNSGPCILPKKCPQKIYTGKTSNRQKG